MAAAEPYAFDTNDTRFMNEAFSLAADALLLEAGKKEVPIGCVFVLDNQIIAKSHNTVNATGNATRHAELNCIDATISFCESHESSLKWSEVFTRITVYVTVEPCVMCLSVLIKLRVPKIIYGCDNDRFGGKSVFDVTNVLSDSQTLLLGGFQKQRAIELLKQFYRGENPKVPQSKRKKRN